MQQGLWVYLFTPDIPAKQQTHRDALRHLALSLSQKQWSESNGTNLEAYTPNAPSTGEFSCVGTLSHQVIKIPGPGEVIYEQGGESTSNFLVCKQVVSKMHCILQSITLQFSNNISTLRIYCKLLLFNYCPFIDNTNNTQTQKINLANYSFK